MDSEDDKIERINGKRLDPPDGKPCRDCDVPVEGCDCPRCERCHELPGECGCFCMGCLKMLCECEA